MLSALHDYSLKLPLSFRIRALDGVPQLPATLHEEIEELLKRNIEIP